MKVKISYMFVIALSCMVFFAFGADSSINAQTGGKYKIAWQSKVGEELQIFMMDMNNPGDATQITDGKNGSKHPTLSGNASRIYYFHFQPTSWGDGDQLFYRDLPDGKERQVQRNAIHQEDDPCVSRDGSTLAYRSKQSLEGEYGTDNWEVVCLKTDFSIAQRITNDIDDELDPSLSADGTCVYFTINVVKDRTELEKKEILEKAEEEEKEIDEESDEYLKKWSKYIYRNNFEGNNLERVTPRDYNAWHPSVSADENWMVFASDMDGDEEIYMMNLETYEIQRLTECPGYDGTPWISSDGQVIVFTSERDGDREIFTMNRSGGDLVQLTENDVEDDNPCIT